MKLCIWLCDGLCASMFLDVRLRMQVRVRSVSSGRLKMCRCDFKWSILSIALEMYQMIANSLFTSFDACFFFQLHNMQSLPTYVFVLLALLLLSLLMLCVVHIDRHTIESNRNDLSLISEHFICINCLWDSPSSAVLFFYSSFFNHIFRIVSLIISSLCLCVFFFRDFHVSPSYCTTINWYVKTV